MVEKLDVQSLWYSCPELSIFMRWMALLIENDEDWIVTSESIAYIIVSMLVLFINVALYKEIVAFFEVIMLVFDPTPELKCTFTKSNFAPSLIRNNDSLRLKLLK